MTAQVAFFARRLLTLFLLTTAGFAVSISNVSVSNVTPTSAMVTWTTDVPSDTFVAYGIAGVSEGTVYNATLVTAHKAALPLWPDREYMYLIRSQSSTAKAFYGFPQGAKNFRTPRATLSPGPVALYLKVEAPTSVVQGYGALVGVQEAQTAGTSGWMTTTVTGLPPATELHWPDYEWNGLAARSYNANSVTVWGATRQQFILRASSQTPQGRYKLTVTVTGPNSFSQSQQVWLNVVPVPRYLKVPQPTYLPLLANLPAWQASMVKYGKAYCGTAKAGDQSTVSYYDGEAVYQEIKAYDAAKHLTGNPAQWDACIAQAQSAYLAWMAQGPVADIWQFSEGLTTAAVAGDAGANAAVAALSTPKGSTWAKLWANTQAPWMMASMRPDAYQLESFLNDEKLGRPHPQQVELLVDALLGMIDCVTTDCTTAGTLESFMGGLASRGLIMYSEAHPEDKRIVPALEAFNSWLYFHLFNTWEQSGAFGFQLAQNRLGYRACDPCNLADLNPLIAPAYAWLFRQTGDRGWLTMGDPVWNGAFQSTPTYALSIDQRWSGGGYGKGFSQAYRWSFKYPAWRGLGGGGINVN